MKIICVGRNYSEHAKELANEVPSEPLLFLKPDTALLRNNDDFFHPEFSKDIHHECELVYRVSREGKFISKRYAKTYLDGIGLGIDFTARDLQSEAKKNGHPWTLAKMFNHSAPVSKFLSLDKFPQLDNLHFELSVNGELRQKGHTADMIFDIETLIAYITQFITIKKGDLIFTGTPAGVAAVKPGDRLEASLEGKKMMDFYVR